MVEAAAVVERSVAGPADFGRIRRFLAARLADTPGLGWDVRMWDGAWFTGAGEEADARRRRSMRLFEDEQGRLVGALLSTADEEIHPQLHPSWRHLEETLIARAESIARDDGHAFVKVLAWASDRARERILQARGYERTERSASLYRLPRLETPPAPVPVPRGYALRPTRPDEVGALAALQNAAFERTRHTAAEMRAFREHAPSFRADLDLVATTDDGTLAAYAAVCRDDDNRRGIFEPVCTHPDHRRRGLQRALMTEGLRRAHALGARSFDVGTGDAEPANALYRAVGFTERHLGWFWTRALTEGGPRRSSRPGGTTVSAPRAGGARPDAHGTTG